MRLPRIIIIGIFLVSILYGPVQESSSPIGLVNTSDLIHNGASNTNFEKFSIASGKLSSNSDSNTVKIMVYNIKESGESASLHDWNLVVQEENADIIMFVETGTWDDNNNAKLHQYCDNFNSFFSNEAPYECYTTQGVSVSTSGEAIMSRYPIVSVSQNSTVPMDDGSTYTLTHALFDVVVTLGSQNVHLVGEHLKCCTGTTNEHRRESEQEGVNNYFDSLGAVPIIYLGDFNSFSPEDIGLNNLQTGLGYGPLSMLLGWPGYESKAPVTSTFTDVQHTLNPTDLGISEPDFDSRIDFIYYNQFVNGSLLSSTTGDTSHAATGSDHYSVDVVMNFTTATPADTIPPAQVKGMTATTLGTTQIDVSWTPNTEPDLDHYNIYRDNVFLLQTGTNSYSDSGLTPDTTYSYSVSAVDSSSNEGQRSDTLKISTKSASEVTSSLLTTKITNATPGFMTGLVMFSLAIMTLIRKKHSF